MNTAVTEHSQLEIAQAMDIEESADLFRKWINQRPGLEYADYGDATAYRSESRRITKQRADALDALAEFERIPYNAEKLADAFKHAFSGRLSLTVRNGDPALKYSTGQYFPTEYRAAALAVLSEYNQNARPKPPMQNVEPLNYIYRATNDLLSMDDMHERHRAEVDILRGVSFMNDFVIVYGFDSTFKDWVFVPCLVAEVDTVIKYMKSRDDVTHIDWVMNINARSISKLGAKAKNATVCAGWRWYAHDVDTPD